MHHRSFAPDLALILSPESPSLPYYSDSLPLKGNSSQACRLTVSGNASDHCSSSPFGTLGCDWPYACLNHEEKSSFVFSRKGMDCILEALTQRVCEFQEQCARSPAGNLLVKAPVDSRGVRYLYRGFTEHLDSLIPTWCNTYNKSVNFLVQYWLCLTRTENKVWIIKFWVWTRLSNIPSLLKVYSIHLILEGMVKTSLETAFFPQKLDERIDTLSCLHNKNEVVTTSLA